MNKLIYILRSKWFDFKFYKYVFGKRANKQIGRLDTILTRASTGPSIGPRSLEDVYRGRLEAFIAKYRCSKEEALHHIGYNTFFERHPDRSGDISINYLCDIKECICQVGLSEQICPDCYNKCINSGHYLDCFWCNIRPLPYVKN